MGASRKRIRLARAVLECVTCSAVFGGLAQSWIVAGVAFVLAALVQIELALRRTEKGGT